MKKLLSLSAAAFFAALTIAGCTKSSEGNPEIKLSAYTMELAENGLPVTLTAELVGIEGSPIFASDNTSVAKINPATGEITPFNIGKANISVIADGKKAVCEVNVIKPYVTVKHGDVVLSDKTGRVSVLNVDLGQSAEVSSEIYPANARQTEIEWSGFSQTSGYYVTTMQDLASGDPRNGIVSGKIAYDGTQVLVGVRYSYYDETIEDPEAMEAERIRTAISGIFEVKVITEVLEKVTEIRGIPATLTIVGGNVLGGNPENPDQMGRRRERITPILLPENHGYHEIRYTSSEKLIVTAAAALDYSWCDVYQYVPDGGNPDPYGTSIITITALNHTVDPDDDISVTCEVTISEPEPARR
jgi:hypothetical protein